MSVLSQVFAPSDLAATVAGCRWNLLHRPSHALYFAAYEASKQKLGGNQPGHHVLATSVSGVVATFVNDTIMTPLDVVKQRLQVRGA